MPNYLTSSHQFPYLPNGMPNPYYQPPAQAPQARAMPTYAPPQAPLSDYSQVSDGGTEHHPAKKQKYGAYGSSSNTLRVPEQDHSRSRLSSGGSSGGISVNSGGVRLSDPYAAGSQGKAPTYAGSGGWGGYGTTTSSSSSDGGGGGYMAPRDERPYGGSQGRKKGRRDSPADRGQGQGRVAPVKRDKKGKKGDGARRVGVYESDEEDPGYHASGSGG
jgi:hypothetical protein